MLKPRENARLIRGIRHRRLARRYLRRRVLSVLLAEVKTRHLHMSQLLDSHEAGAARRALIDCPLVCTLLVIMQRAYWRKITLNKWLFNSPALASPNPSPGVPAHITEKQPEPTPACEVPTIPLPPATAGVDGQGHAVTTKAPASNSSNSSNRSPPARAGCKKVQIFVETPTGKTITLRVLPLDKVASVKQQVQVCDVFVSEKRPSLRRARFSSVLKHVYVRVGLRQEREGYPSDKQMLTFEGKHLCDGLTLMDYHIKSSTSTLRLSLRIRGGTQVTTVPKSGCAEPVLRRLLFVI